MVIRWSDLYVCFENERSKNQGRIKGLVTKQGTYASRLDFSTCPTGEESESPGLVVIPNKSKKKKKNKSKALFYRI